jgi:Cu2+-exporting ATPase/Cu+-exporting ATPase
MAKEQTYSVKGMHCASCEILIEKKLLEIQNVKSVDASTSDGKVVVEYEGEKPSNHKLNEMFKQENYKFTDVIPGLTRNPETPQALWILAFARMTEKLDF